MGINVHFTVQRDAGYRSVPLLSFLVGNSRYSFKHPIDVMKMNRPHIRYSRLPVTPD